MTSSDGAAKKPLSPPETPNMVFSTSDFNSSDFAKLLMKSKDTDFLKSFDVDGCNFEFLKSLDVLKNSGGDPTSVFKTLDFLKSLDSLKSVDSLAAAKDSSNSKEAKQASAAPAAVKKALTSRDWVDGYEPEHVDISYDKALFQSGEAGKAGPAPQSRLTSATASSDPSKWMAIYLSEDGGLASAPVAASPAAAPPMPAPAAIAPSLSDVYADVLRNPMQNMPLLSTPMPSLSSASAAAVAAAPAVQEKAKASASNNTKKSTKPKKKRVYKSRKVIPDNKVYVDFTDKDILMGRGGLSNKHPGNKWYREQIEEAKPVYRAASKEEKTHWASLLVSYVQKNGGRFLEKDRANGKWYIVPDIVARRKAGQALREDNTDESRRIKRERYKKKQVLSEPETTKKYWKK